MGEIDPAGSKHRDPGQVPLHPQPGEARTSVDTPLRPELASHVQLAGELQGTGFQDRQWLIQRDNHFIQVTELLYRIAEHADGERSLGEIADRVTDSTDWMVTADQVQHLIQSKLVPLGIVAPTDGRVLPTSPARSPSPLQLRMRVKMLGPHVIDPFTRVLQYLYAPVILLPALLGIVLAHAWLYLDHGIAGSTRAALTTPGALLVLLIIMLVAGVVHEFGHAAALRYGGGQVRGMGVGLYLIYPAFYTDVTDSYRLGRWGRVRTDLGGFYFHLLFAVGVMGLYRLTELEYLLVAVLLINLDIVRQCMPFVRFDGYWALADLTGIPDFFSQMGAFIRSVLPLPGEGPKLPNLKAWVKAVFAAYIVVTIPLLAFLLVLTVWRVPHIVETSLDAMATQANEIAEAWRGRNALGVVAAGSQLLLLALPLLALTYFFYGLIWRPLRGLWWWSKPTPARRVTGAVIAGVIIVLAVLLAAPRVPFLDEGDESAPAGVQSFEATERTHVDVPVAYAQIPPVAGNHAPMWQNCGFYDAPIRNENAVHSLEHGAVWITYRPGLPDEQVDALRRLAEERTFVLVSPYPGLPTPVVASAWGRQLRLDATDDPRLDQFVRAFRVGPQTPERGAPCTGGIGQPAS